MKSEYEVRPEPNRPKQSNGTRSSLMASKPQTEQFQRDQSRTQQNYSKSKSVQSKTDVPIKLKQKGKISYYFNDGVLVREEMLEVCVS